MIKQPLVTVIIPVYNSQLFLERCILSVINQSYKKIQLILVNDGSTDNSLAICQKFSDRAIIIDKANTGVSDSRNIGLDAAEGDFISFVDSDDYLDKDMYKLMVADALSKDAQIVQCDYNLVDIDGNEMGSANFIDQIVDGKQSCCEFYLKERNVKNFVWNKLYDACIIKEERFPIARMSEDYAMNVVLFSKADRVSVISQRLYYYVQHNESVCNRDFNPSYFDILNMGSLVLEYVVDKFVELEYLVHMYNLNYCMVIYSKINSSNLSSEKKKEAVKELRTRFKTHFKRIPIGLFYKERKRLLIKGSIFLLSPSLLSFLINKRR